MHKNRAKIVRGDAKQSFSKQKKKKNISYQYRSLENVLFELKIR